jgi:hypothetical protein
MGQQMHRLKPTALFANLATMRSPCLTPDIYRSSARIECPRLEDDQALQDAVLSVHHATILTMNMTPAIKLIENDRGVAFIQQMQPIIRASA